MRTLYFKLNGKQSERRFLESETRQLHKAIRDLKKFGAENFQLFDEPYANGPEEGAWNYKEYLEYSN